MKERDTFTPLPGHVSGPMYSARLYRGPHHLLKSTVQGFHEHFRKFAWEDIQGVVVEETPWNGIVNVSMVLVLSMLVVSFLTFTDKDWRAAILYMPFLMVISLLLLVNLRRGPTCKAWLITAVSRDRLWSINRLAAAEELVAAIAPVIRERQDAAARAEAEAGSFAPEDGPPRTAPSARKTGMVEVERGRWHAAALALIAVFLIMDIVNANLANSNRFFDFFGISAFAASCMVCITALVLQTRNRAPRALTRFGFVLAAYHIAIVGFGLGGIASMLAKLMMNRGDFRALEPRQYSWYLPTLYAEMALHAATLAFGAFTFIRLRQQAKLPGAGPGL